jgi:FkbM family methyltransferase
LSLSWSIAKGVHGIVRAFPHDYGVKVARKIRHELSGYTREQSPLTSEVGPLYIAGVRRGLDKSYDINDFEPELVRWINTCFGPTDTFWDIGGHVGLYCIYAAKRHPDLKVFSFEPGAGSYLELVGNLQVNGVDQQVKALNIALADATGLIAMPLVSFEPGFTTTTEVAMETGTLTDGIGMQWVTGIAGDDFAKMFDAAPDHIKLDVDGAEIAIIQGARNVLKTCKSLLIEVIGPIADEYETTIAPILAEAGLVEVPVTAPTSGRNRVFVRPGAVSATQI